jgi:hypothetical protein
MGRPTELIRLTFGDLLNIPNLGIRSALDFAVMLEAHLQRCPAQDEIASVEQLDLLVQEKRAALIFAAGEDWAECISGKDRRFSDLLGSASPILAERIEDVLERDDTRAIDVLVASLPELKARIKYIGSLPLEDALLELFNATAKLRGARTPLLIRRFGWDGEPPETLEQVGQRLGVTRERIRQIQVKIVRELPKHPIFMPHLQRAIELLEATTPISVNDASELLRTKGISQRAFHPQSIIAAAADCNLATSLRIQTIRGKKLVTARTDERVASRLATIARKQSGASGATDVTEVVEQAHAEGLDFEDERAIRLMRSLPDVQWSADDWFWTTSIPIERNRLRNVARKMLSVTSPIHARTIRSGMRRLATWRNSTGGRHRWPFRAPPSVVVLRFLEWHPEFDVNELGLVTPVNDLDYTAELGDAERAIVDAIRSTPTGILDRQSIRDKCISRGVNAHSIEVLLSYSPLIEHLGVNLWTIAGTLIDPSALEAVRAANALRPRARRVSDFGWTETGNIWVSVIVPSYHTSSFVFGIPGGVKRYLIRQKFAITDEFGRKYGQVGITEDGSTYGAGPLLRRKGADPGDTMLCEFNLTGNTVLIRVGGEEVTAGL